eukprot:TRINITY_DN55_c0_g1_i6.p2 TRINITY_DN55_c0_g1~~TRINITY_DN55_c0_g1_i6.p2  ORF type:complete len:358 (+),score=14.44 TRINITY_DN55_c0_g1_i6:87-1160(+)
MEQAVTYSDSATESKVQRLEQKCKALAEKCEQMFLETMRSESKVRALGGYIQALKRTFSSLVYFAEVDSKQTEGRNKGNIGAFPEMTEDEPENPPFPRKVLNVAEAQKIVAGTRQALTGAEPKSKKAAKSSAENLDESISQAAPKKPKKPKAKPQEAQVAEKPMEEKREEHVEVAIPVEPLVKLEEKKETDKKKPAKPSKSAKKTKKPVEEKKEVKKGIQGLQIYTRQSQVKVKVEEEGEEGKHVMENKNSTATQFGSSVLRSRGITRSTGDYQSRSNWCLTQIAIKKDKLVVVFSRAGRPDSSKYTRLHGLHQTSNGFPDSHYQASEWLIWKQPSRVCQRCQTDIHERSHLQRAKH